MRLEAQDTVRCAEFARDRPRRSDHRAVTTMHAIEVAESQHGTGRVGWEGGIMPEKTHGNRGGSLKRSADQAIGPCGLLASVLARVAVVSGPTIVPHFPDE
ncbi:hypothetical protein GCM10011611_32900 [Aliidongia dinghuensis]|uniref:Uncharacterized protein n=1 Tax=Aliidongia dinghuensis TaxID=1867774 RepID=A0A8J2YV61_9PROT|nr:hypothetical protein GCM10011611_32900 [Aliidongia dinghuensis]